MRRTFVPLWLGSASKPHAGTFVVLFAIEAWSRATLITVVPLQALKLLGNAQSVSFVYFAVALIGLISTMIIPMVVYRIRRRWAFSLGGLLMMASLWFYAAGDPTLFAIGLAIQVVATAFLEIVMNLFVLDHVPRSEITKFEPRRLVFVAAPFTFGPWLGIWVAETVSPQMTFLLVAVFVAALMVFFWFLRLTDNKAVTMPLKLPPNPIRYLPRFFAQPRLRLAWVLATGRSSWWMMFFVYAPIYLSTSGYSPEMTGMIMSISLGSLFLAGIWGAIGRKYGMRFILISGYALAGVLTIMIAVLQDWPLIALALVVASAFASSLVDGAGNIPFLRSVHSYERAEMTSVYVTYRHTAQLLTPGVFSLVLGVFALPAVFIVGGTCFLSMAWLARYLPKKL